MARVIEGLISEFNADSNDTKLVEYLSEHDIFNTSGKSPVERWHSETIGELLAGTYGKLRKETS